MFAKAMLQRQPMTAQKAFYAMTSLSARNFASKFFPPTPTNIDLAFPLQRPPFRLEPAMFASRAP